MYTVSTLQYMCVLNTDQLLHIHCVHCSQCTLIKLYAADIVHSTSCTVHFIHFTIHVDWPHCTPIESTLLILQISYILHRSYCDVHCTLFILYHTTVCILLTLITVYNVHFILHALYQTLCTAHTVHTFTVQYTARTISYTVYTLLTLYHTLNTAGRYIVWRALFTLYHTLYITLHDSHTRVQWFK
jgi:hypothetical protein